MAFLRRGIRFTQPERPRALPATPGNVELIPDADPPIISNIAVSNITASGATVTWTTDELADSTLFRGTSPAYDLGSANNSALLQAHSMAMTGLTDDTTYHFKVRSSDFTGNTADSSDGTFKTLTVALAVDAIILPPGVDGTAYPVTTFTAGGGESPYTWDISVGALPSGLVLDASGVMTGTPDTVGTANFTVRATDSVAGVAGLALSIEILAAPDTTAPVISGVSHGTPADISATITWTTDEGSKSILATGLTTGLEQGTTTLEPFITSHSMNLTGLAQNTQVFYQVSSEDASGNTANGSLLSFTTATQVPPVAIDPPGTLPSGEKDVGYTGFTYTAAGGVPPYTWDISGGALPTGMALSTAGVLSGTPTVVETAGFTVRVTDSDGPPDTNTVAGTIDVIDTTALSLLESTANGMASETWVIMGTNGFNYTLLTQDEIPGTLDASPIFGFSENGVWDSVNKKAYFVGSSHNGPATLIEYNAATNTWVELTGPGVGGVGGPGHGYGQFCIDPIAGVLYYREPGSGATITVHRYTIATAVWDTIATLDPNGFNQVAGGMDWFPDIGTEGYLILANGFAGGSEGEVYFWVKATNSWITSTAAMGDIYAFACYNPVHKVVLFGGGSHQGGTDESKKIYSIDTLGAVRSETDAPQSLGVTNAIVVADPANGLFIVLRHDDAGGNRLFTYDYATQTWTQTTISTPPLDEKISAQEPRTFGVVGIPIDSYGVIMYPKYTATDPRVYLYKHSSGLVASTDWSARTSDPGVLLAQNFSGFVDDNDLQTHELQSNPSRLSLLATGHAHALSGKACRVTTLTSDGEVSNGFQQTLNGVDADTQVPIVYNRVYVQFIVWADDYFDWPFRTRDGSTNAPKLFILDRAPQWAAEPFPRHSPSANPGEVVIDNQHTYGLIHTYRRLTAPGNSFQEFFRPLSTPANSSNLLYHPSVDKGGALVTQDDYESRYGSMRYGMVSSDSHATEASQASGSKLTAQYPGIYPDPEAAAGSIAYNRGGFTVVEIFADYVADRCQIWAAHRGNDPLLIVDSLDDNEGAAKFNQRGDIDGWDGYHLTNFRTGGGSSDDESCIGQPDGSGGFLTHGCGTPGSGARPEMYVDYAEVIVSLKPIPFPGKISTPLPGNLS